MWQKKNPYLEYAIACCGARKKGYIMGIVKTEGPKEGEPAVERAGSSGQ